MYAMFQLVSFTQKTYTAPQIRRLQPFAFAHRDTCRSVTTLRILTFGSEDETAPTGSRKNRYELRGASRCDLRRKFPFIEPPLASPAGRSSSVSNLGLSVLMGSRVADTAVGAMYRR
jgi:hypothetical protein